MLRGPGMCLTQLSLKKKISKPKITRYPESEDCDYSIRLINMVMDKKEVLIRKTSAHISPYSPISNIHTR